MIFYWENNTDLVVSTYGGPQFFYGATGTTPPVSAVGVWLMNLDNEQVVYWQDHSDALSAGAFQVVWTSASTTPAVAAIILQRSVERFVFAGLFRRVN